MNETSTNPAPQKPAKARFVVLTPSGRNPKTGAYRRRKEVINGSYKDALRAASKTSKEERLVELLQDALEAIDDMLDYTPEDLEEYGRAVISKERRRIGGELELLGYDGFFDRY